LKKLGMALAVVGVSVALATGLTACGSGSSGKEGGTLKAAYSLFPESLDPQLSYSAEGWNSIYDTYIPLLTYKHANGQEGSEVIPGLARSLPKVSDGGRTYTLFLRKGLKYSNGTPVKASDFTFAVERMFRINSPGTTFYTDIVGTEKFAETKSGGIPGIKTNDKTGEIIIDLVKPRGTFTNELGLPFVAPVPPDTPTEDMTNDPPPATGPYAIVSSKPGHSWTYERNPQWAGNNSRLMPEIPSGHVDRIEVSVISNQSTEVNDVEQGKLDTMLDPVPADRITEVTERYNGTQFRSEPNISTYFFWMNTNKAPFNNLKVRQAINYAVNSEALERIYSGTIKASQQILPPNMPGYEKYVLYPHNMSKARELLAQADPPDRNITVWTDNVSPNKEAGEYYDALLKQLGFHTKLEIRGENYFTEIGSQSTSDLDTGWANWGEDYPHPNDFFQPTLDGSSIAPSGNTNLAQIDVPSLNEKIERLGTQELGPQQEKEYAALDKEFMELAPWAPYGTRVLSTFVSSAIDLDKVIWNPTFSDDLTSFQFK
jgi:peptide/nickel transport system substrate-binding protein